MKRLNVAVGDIPLDTLRKTKPEILLEASFDRYGLPYTAQKSIAGTVWVDIFVEPNICIFVDGDYWHNYPMGLDKDKRQNRLLESWGYRVSRVWEHDILENPDLIANKLIKDNGIKIENSVEDYFK